MVIDIRDRNSYLLGHIDDAINIDKSALLSNPDKYLNKTDIYYIYCNSGISSKRVVNQLNLLGYNTVNIDGGYNKFKS